MNDQSTYEIIERYLAGTLSEVELAAFERRLETEPELQDELQVHRDLQDAVGDTEVMAFLQSVENAENEYLAGNLETGGDQDAAPEPRVIRPFWRQSYSIAAAVILLAVVGFFVFRGMGGGSSGSSTRTISRFTTEPSGAARGSTRKRS
jgi:anti-sigma factor RsiW